jgi:hypothetical protein
MIVSLWERRREGIVFIRLIALALSMLMLTACFDEVPSEEAIASVLETLANQELAQLKAAPPPPGTVLMPDAVRIMNLKKLGAVTDSKGIYVASVQFDLMVELKGARTLNQRGAKARLKLERSGSGWKIVDKQ